MPGIASSAPAVLAATLAASTEHDPGRLRRGDAAQPRAAGRRRAVRDARGAAPGPDRPRDRPRARAPTRSPRRRCAARAEPLSDDDFPRQLAELIGVLQRRVPRRPPVRRDHRGPGRRRHARDLAARLERLSAPSSPGCSGCRSPSPTTSAPQHRRPRSSSTASSFRPSEYLDRALRDGRRRGDLRRRRRARALARRPGAALDGAASRRAPDPLPDPRGGRRARVHRPPRRRASARSRARR